MGKLSLAVLISAAIHGYFIYKQPEPREISLSAGGQNAAPSLSIVAISTAVAAPAAEPKELVPEPAPIEPAPAVQPEPTVAPVETVNTQPLKPAPVKQPIAPPVAKDSKRESQIAKSSPKPAPSPTQPTQQEQVEKTLAKPLELAAKPDDKLEPVTEKLNPAPAAASQVNSKVEVDSGLAQQPRLNSQPRFAKPPTAPVYPRLAKKRGLEGTVMVEVWLDPKGQQTKREINASSGVKSLDKAALKAVKKWRFKALMVDGQAQASRALIPIRFKLS
ncbi:energy transducer TonB [Agarivorans sp. 1_MG-2023]|uniref:energy transducer TonB n=1 Tax=Agarivorans sp. 1_MG-2023 TaxID=3062634 RepID=UPI0026E1822F|nr:energy transducer TonB [Agarivorans sp. 1_MG-2023]MDO6762836.1 TonB family protein [Agarivorans sp. 1_MG-2023]